MVLQSIVYARGNLQVLDQLQLPHLKHYDTLRTAEQAWQAIKAMRVRGAPAIAIVAALSVAVELEQMRRERCLPGKGDAAAMCDFVGRRLDYLLSSRPTAVNLADAVAKLKGVVEERRTKGGDAMEVLESYVLAAEKMMVDDVRDNEAIGRHGAEWILKNTDATWKGDEERVSVLTHCNTGSLATAGYGTALGVIRALHASESLHHVYCTETRPYNQGSRLTAYELVHDEIPATLVTDSMAATLLWLKQSTENLNAIVVGADRVAANGDTANKIGTYALAVLARHHGVKFIVAAPRTTIDLKTASGRDIVIEERPRQEVTEIRGPSGGDGMQTIAIAAQGIEVWNPAFDVTPSELIDAVITEVGAVEKNAHGEFDFQPVFER